MSPDSEVLLSSHSTKARLISIALAVVTGSAVLAAAIVGWVGIPQSRASAASAYAASSAANGESPKFAKVVAKAVPASAKQRLLPAAKKRVAVKKRDVSKVRSLGSGPWRQARCSWYGPGFYGNTMAGGGKLRRDSMVVAHKTMKFGTRIVFSYKGRSVVAVVRDRGPYISGRTFDLGPGTAKALKFQGVGTVKYRIL